MSTKQSLLVGAAAAAASRIVLRQLLLARFRRDVRALNAGDHRRLLSAYAEDAVLRFNDGPHRWAGEHRGRAAIEDFLREFTRAGLHGEVREVWFGGPPWAMTIVERFDDSAEGPDGEQLYRNRVAMLIHTRWGKIVRQQDFYEDSGRIETFERRLTELGVPRAA